MKQKRPSHTISSPFERFFASFEQKLPVFRGSIGTFCRRPPTVRVNRLKLEPEAFIDQASRARIKVQRVSWSNDAFIIPDAPQREVENLPAYDAGAIYLQSLASQVPPLVLNPKPGMRVLDLCAAPGGKTAQIAALMKGEGELWAVEKDRIRFERMLFNLRKQGVLDAPKLTVEARHGDGLSIEFPADGFDAILLDAPCSGESRFVKDDSRTWEHWSESFVTELAKLQKQLLVRACSLLKPGGTLVYSTCTFNTEENELVVAAALANGLKVSTGCSGAFSKGVPEHVSAQISLGGKLSPAGFRLKPSKQLEGFFLAHCSRNG